MIHLGGAVANRMMMATHVEMIAKITSRGNFHKNIWNVLQDNDPSGFMFIT